MLRSLGSTLVAKTSPGAALRTADEDRKQGAVAQSTQSAQPENVQRETIAQPLEVQVPEGSQKAVSVQPLIQPRLEPGQEPGGIVPQMGGAAQAAVTGQSISANRPVNPGGGGAGSPGRSISAPVASRSVSSGAATKGGTQAAAYRPESAPGNVQRFQNTPNESVGSFFGGIGSLGGRVAAEGQGNVTIPRNISQAVAATVAPVVKKINPGVGGALANYSNNKQVTNSGVGSISKPGATANTVIRSVQQAVSNAGNFLRSLAAPKPAQKRK